MNNLFRGLLSGIGAWKLGGGCVDTMAVAWDMQLAIKSGADYFFNKAEDFEKVSHVVAGIIRDTINDTKLKIQV